MMSGKLPYAAIVPAAGRGSRLSLPHSKELLTVGFEEFDKKGKTPKAITSYLIDHFNRSGVHDIHIILRDGKTDIIDYFKSGNTWGVDISYHLTEVDDGVPFTIDQAYPFYKNKNILFGFPDILFQPMDAYGELKKFLNSHANADIVLGLFPVNEQHKWDTVIINESNRIEKIRVKENFNERVKYAWIIAAWKPVFSDFIHKKVNEFKTFPAKGSNELYIGHVIQLAIENGLKVFGLAFDQGTCLDVGTPDGYLFANRFVDQWFRL